MSAGLTCGIERSDNEGKYRSRNPVVQGFVRRFLRRVGDLVEAQRPRRILEVGCGEGFVLRYLAQRLPAVRLDGLEVDPGALARGRARCPGASFVHGDLMALPFRSGSYDLVLCLEVLEHLPEPDRALQEIRRVSVGGCLLSVPHEPFFRLGNLLRGKNLRRLGDPTDHLQHWSARGFTALCGRHLTVRTATTSFPWLLVYGTV
ncbi:MAG: class I SAM-dependent methyltransferase [Candidatus Rokubacteria bacterium]|nr:class I SAM-dependent methyltransferase [Candidatus Rokubacteria bacterium]